MNKTHIKWTQQLVAHHFEEASLTERQLPSVRVQGYFKSLPNVIRTPGEMMELERLPVKRKRVMPDAISRLKQAHDWVSWLPTVEERKTMWWRAARISFRNIGEKLQRSHSKVRDQWNYSLIKISFRLNQSGIKPSAAVIERAHKEEEKYAKMDH